MSKLICVILLCFNVCLTAGDSTETEEVSVVLKAPVLTSNFQKVNGIHFGTDKLLGLNCNASGWPIPTIEWFKNHEKISTVKSSRNRIQIYNKIRLYMCSILMINNTQEADSGSYMCVAFNRVGSQLNVVQLGVSGEIKT